MQRSIMRKGVLVSFDDADRTNDQALTILRKQLADRVIESDFARDLASKAPRLSEKQWCWVHFLVKEAAERDQQKAASANMQLPRIFKLLTTVKLERPCIELGVFGVTVKVKLTKRRDRVSIVVNDTYLARIDSCAGDVYLVTSAGLDDKTRATLAVMELDPVGAATLNGRVTGQCCFCQRHLETKESVTAGYGPVCADKWGLPWGHTEADTLISGVRDQMSKLFPQIG